MTDTTDIKALRDQPDHGPYALVMAQNEALTKGIVVLQSQLEAERQRADEAVTERNTALKQASAARNGFDEQYKLREKAEESVTDLYSRLLRTEETLIASNDLLSAAEAEIAALKAKLANPVSLPRVAAVCANLSDQARHRTSPENVRDVMIALCKTDFPDKGE